MPDSFLEPEFAPHYEAWKANPNPKMTSNLLKAINPVIDSAMRSYSVGAADSPTLRSKAKFMALAAIQKYDPSRAKLRTHLMTNLQGLRRASVRESQIITVPERVGLDRHRMLESERFLSDKLGRTPSDMELADHTGLSRKRISYVRQAQPGLAEGSLVNRDDDKERPVSIGVKGPEDNAWINFIYHDLSPIDQVIMEHTLGMHGQPVLLKQQIAGKLKLSPGAISQRAAKIQKLLDQREELDMALF